MGNDFSIEFVSDSRYEFMVVEISYREQLLCRLNKENGVENIEVEFDFDSRVLSSDVQMKFPLLEFEKILEEARADLVASN